MRAHYLQHVPFEGLGSIEPWLLAHHDTITHTPLFRADDFPDPDDIDFLIILGGPMSVNDESDYPWLITEKEFIRTFAKTGKPMLGICLGAQLIANVCGAPVYPNTTKEIGWFPITATATDNDNFTFPPKLTVFQWHGETFDLPQGATRLASSTACQNQAFQIGTNIIGLQFHLETTPAAAQSLATNCRSELIAAAYIQQADQILSAPTSHYQTINQETARLLEYLIR